MAYIDIWWIVMAIANGFSVEPPGLGKGGAMQWGLSKGERTARRRVRDLVQECEAYLSGEYAEYLGTRHENIPNWAWLNVLAQGSPERLRSLAAESTLSGGPRTRTSAWWQAVVFLAREILDHQHNDRGLDELRRSVLVPLELKLMVTDRALQRPGELVRTVREALDQYPSSRRQ